MSISDGAAWWLAAPLALKGAQQIVQGSTGMIVGAMTSSPVTIPNVGVTYNATLALTGGNTNRATFNDSFAGLTTSITKSALYPSTSTLGDIYTSYGIMNNTLNMANSANGCGK